MKIKKYISTSLKEGKKLIEEELGEDAVILSTRTTKDPETGDNKVEIVAAIDENISVKENKPTDNNSNEAIKPSIEEKLDQLLQSIKTPLSPYLDERLRNIYNYLKNIGFNEEYSANFIQEISKNKDLPESNESILDLLISKIQTENLFQKKLSRKIYRFSGTAGSGKTSSLLKFAIVHKLMNDSDILVISTESYKFGAKELLSAYCNMLEIDFLHSKNDENLEEILKNNKDKNLILIDTDSKDAGSLNISKISKLEDIIVLPAIYNRKLLRKILKSKVEYIALTFVDQLDNIAEIFDIIEESDSKLVFYTTGEKIPDDIELANFEGIKKLIELHE